MHKVFELTEEELRDLWGDTRSVTDIQRRVKEMLEEPEEKCKEICQQIQTDGPRALPGVLNATYVFTGLLKGKDQELLASLLAELVGENQAAREMLLKAGVLEAPFVPTRQTALLALQQLGDIRVEEKLQIRTRAWRDANDSEDYQAALVLYEFLIRQGDTQAAAEAQDLALHLFKSYVDIGPSFLSLALQGNPNDTYNILTQVMEPMDCKSKSLGKEIGKRVSPEAMNNLTEILRATNQLMETAKGFAHKGVEYLFTGPIARYLEQHPDVIEETSDLVEQKYVKLYRYWWQGLGIILELESVQQYFVDRAIAPLDDFAGYGAIQLMFIKKYNEKFKLWATDLLECLERDTPDQYQDLLYWFDKFGPAAGGAEVKPSDAGLFGKRP